MFKSRRIGNDAVENLFKLVDAFGVKLASAGVGSVLAYFLGASEFNHAALEAVGILYVVDTLTGVVCAVREGRFSSRGYGRAVSKLLVYCSVLVVASQMARFVPGLSADARASAVGVALSVIGVTEAISILENALRLGVDLPAPMKRWIRSRIGELKSIDEKPEE